MTEKETSRRDYLKAIGAGIAGLIVGAGATYALVPPTEKIVEKPVEKIVEKPVEKIVEKPVEVIPPYLKKIWIPTGKMWVPIVNKYMTYDEICDGIEAEGKVTIANWTYWGLSDELFEPNLAAYVKERYDVDIEVEVLGTQPAKGGFMYQVEAAQAAGMYPPYDLMHLEANFFEEGVMKEMAEPFLPSPLVPNAQFVDAHFIRYPYGIQFQQHALCNLTVNTNYVGDWFKRWSDLADPRLKGKITLWVTTDNGLWAAWTALCADLGGDYKKEADMKKAIEFFAEKIHPNVLKYTSDEADIMENLETETSWVGAFWCCLAEGYALTRPHLKGPLLEPWMPNCPGIYFVPKNVEHPLLSQVAADYFISPEHQYVDIEKWPVVEKEKWLMMEEGPIGYYYEQFEPAWLKELGPKGQFEVYPTLEDAKTKLKLIDWAYVAAHAEEWVRYFEELIA